MGESFIRWQSILINQLGFTNNLIIGLSIGVLGYLINFLQQVTILNCFQKFFFWIACISIIYSLTMGLKLVINRLDDFKITANIARKRETNKREGIEEDRKKVKEIGEKTWNLLIWQISTFFASLICTLVIILIEYGDKIT
ncbi:MAG: hypothetical protein EKK56_02255 [Flavobacteriaceae bacterium]|nr:MAG: hypothetical protein EKK56_02255 [Flavobacteriaceae bacterium]